MRVTVLGIDGDEDGVDVVAGDPGWRDRVGGAESIVLIVRDRARSSRTDALWGALVRCALAACAGRQVTVLDGGHPDSALAGVYGNHERFVPPAELLPSAGVDAMVDERESLLAERDALNDALAAAVAVGTAPPDVPLLPPVITPPIRYRSDVTGDPEAYRLWIASNDAGWRAEARTALASLESALDMPTISILVPVYRPDGDLLERCVHSVLAQSYTRWELCLFDDCSGDPAVTETLRSFAARDARIRIGAGEENGGISAATNGAAGLASGPFVAFLDQDDQLDADALTWVADAIVRHPDVDVVYTDEDKLDGTSGDRLEPYFKPDWSPELLLSNMYIGHFFVVRRRLFDDVGGLRSTHDGSQDYDLALRVTERARRVVHVPRVVYHWRKTAGSTALDYTNKPQSDVAARRALTDALERRGVDGWVESGLHEGTFRIRRRLVQDPSVAIIIPFHDAAPLLDVCMRSLDATVDLPGCEILLVDNRSWEPETSALVASLARSPRVRVLAYDEPFNWSAINNMAAAKTDAEYLVFMNSDIEATTAGWLEAMLEPAQDDGVGVVGARLLYPDGRIQHAGVVLGLGGVAWHPFCFLPAEQPGYFAQPRVLRNWSAVTGACMLVPHATFDDVGAFDESLPTAFNDVDFCIRVRESGRRIVYTPFAELVHHESASRGTSAMEILESVDMFERYGDILKHDPFFNPNLDITRQEYWVSAVPKEVDPWKWIEWLAESLSSDSGQT